MNSDSLGQFTLFQALAIASTFCLTPASALACSWPEPMVSAVTLPNDGSDVPTNASILVDILSYGGDYFRVPGLHLTKGDELDPISLEIYAVESGDLLHWFVSPPGGFEPSTSYTFTVTFDEVPSDVYTNSNDVFSQDTFQTAIAADEDPPSALGLFELEGDYYKAEWNHPCPNTESGRILGEMAPISEFGGAFYEVEVSNNVNFASPNTYFMPSSYSIETFSMGIGRGDPAFVRVRAVDLSDNAGPWSEIEEVQIPMCALAHNAPSGLFSFIFIGLAAFIGGRRSQFLHSPEQSDRG